MGESMLAIVIRRKEVVTVALVVALVSAVAILTSYVSVYIEGVQNLILQKLNSKFKLIPVGSCEGSSCLLMCEATITYNNRTVSIPVIVSNETSLETFKATIKIISGQVENDSILIGYILADEMNLGPGHTVNISVNSRKEVYRIAGVYRSKSAIDYGALLVSEPFGETNCSRYTLSASSKNSVGLALRDETLRFLGAWSRMITPIFIVTTLIVTVDSVGKLTREARIIEYEGGSGIVIVRDLAFLVALSTVSGFALGIVVGDLMIDLVATMAEVPVVRPELPWKLVFEGIVVRPTIAFLIALGAGVAAWRHWR